MYGMKFKTIVTIVLRPDRIVLLPILCSSFNIGTFYLLILNVALNLVFIIWTSRIMSSGLLSLKWNNHRSTFFHVLSSIRSKMAPQIFYCVGIYHERESYCDATLACDGRFYPVHKLVLSTCSEYFEQIFERTQCKHPVIVLKDIKYDDLEALMNYMYVGEVNVLQEKLAGLIKAAECLKIKGLAVPDEDPTNNNKRNPGRVGGESPHAKRRRREEAFNHEDRERHNVSNRSCLNQRDQLPQIDTHNDSAHIDQSTSSGSKIRVENNNQRIVEVDSDQKQHDEGSADEQHCAKNISEESDGRLSSQKPAPEILGSIEGM
ncbi:Longitudinals lacking protein, isoforms H/M/V [Armadillidium vulgare]|nr:Longitudinals lacking protein, isoforms H/M/V [Armadillidium vulgare]